MQSKMDNDKIPVNAPSESNVKKDSKPNMIKVSIFPSVRLPVIQRKPSSKKTVAQADNPYAGTEWTLAEEFKRIPHAVYQIILKLRKKKDDSSSSTSIKIKTAASRKEYDASLHT